MKMDDERGMRGACVAPLLIYICLTNGFREAAFGSVHRNEATIG
jgi:hypothetical protein